MPTQQEINAWAEAQYLREKIAKLEGSINFSPASSATARYEGQLEAAKWQEPFETHGRVVPPQREGEPLKNYSIRLGSMMQEYSPEWKGAPLRDTPDFMVDKVLGDIRADALKPESHRADIPEGQIKEIVKRDESGRPRHEFISSDNKTTFINETGPNSLMAWGRVGARRVVSYLGLPRDPAGSRLDRAKPVSMGRIALNRGLPRSA